MKDRLGRLVALVAVLGLLAQAATLLLVHGSRAVAPLPFGWAHGWPLIAVCLALTFGGDGTGSGLFKDPRYIAIDGSGNQRRKTRLLHARLAGI